MATSVDDPQLSDLHMLVLVALAVYGRADADAIAGSLDLPVALVEALCDELEDAGRLTIARGC
jgi:DNA-binding MarR family transcriptional regulator